MQNNNLQRHVIILTPYGCTWRQRYRRWWPGRWEQPQWWGRWGLHCLPEVPYLYYCSPENIKQTHRFQGAPLHSLVMSLSKVYSDYTYTIK